MVDGRTSLIKAMEGNDMPMIDTLLGADKSQNFDDKNGFMYQMVELYQREDRGISTHFTATRWRLGIAVTTLGVSAKLLYVKLG